MRVMSVVLRPASTENHNNIFWLGVRLMNYGNCGGKQHKHQC